MGVCAVGIVDGYVMDESEGRKVLGWLNVVWERYGDGRFDSSGGKIRRRCCCGGCRWGDLR